MEKNMAGTNEFAFFSVEAYAPGGVHNQAETNAFWPVPVPINIYFSRSLRNDNNFYRQ